MEIGIKLGLAREVSHFIPANRIARMFYLAMLVGLSAYITLATLTC